MATFGEELQVKNCFHLVDLFDVRIVISHFVPFSLRSILLVMLRSSCRFGNWTGRGVNLFNANYQVH